MSTVVRDEVAERVARLTIDRSEACNALDADVRAELWSGVWAPIWKGR